MLSGKRISDLLLEVYDFERRADFSSHLFAVFKDCIPSTINYFAVTDLESGRMEIKKAVHLRGAAVLPLSAMNAAVKDHPFRDYFLDNSAGAVLATLDIMSDEEWKRSRVYEQLHRPHGSMYDTSIRFYYGSKCMSFHFSDLVPLDMDNRRLLTLIAPHLGRAYRLHHDQDQGFLRALPDYILTLDKAGHILDFPEQCRTLFRRYFFDYSHGPQKDLPAPVKQWVKRITASAPAGGDLSAGRRKVLSRRDKHSLEISLHRGENCLLLILEEIRVVRVIDALMDLGLTKREAEVMTWVAQGKQNSEVASILGIRPPTVRKHVEHILQKLRCETRGAAAQLAIGSASEGDSGAQCRFCTKAACDTCSM